MMDLLPLSLRTGSTVGFEKVFVTKATTTAREINEAIANGLHVMLTPHVYHLEEPIVGATEPFAETYFCGRKGP